MKLQAKINDEHVDIDFTREGDSVKATVGGREYDLKISEPEPNLFALGHGAEMTEVFVSPARPGEPFNISAKEHQFDIEIVDPKRLRGSGSDAEHAGGSAEIKTAMPGKVVRVLVASGDTVAKGDGVIIVEAMKMQNEMKAPKDGTVREIKAAEGQTVNAGDVLVVIE